MANPAVQGAVCACSFGTAQVPLTVTSQQTVTICGSPAATLFDGAPVLNVPSFGMCSNPLNPAVAAATAAAFGTPTPAPCVPITVAWVPGSPTVQVCGRVLLQNLSTLQCSYGGVIQISGTPAVQVTVP